jgi:hypothetical protein
MAVGYGLPVSTPARDDDSVAAARADLRQAEYFRGVLQNECHELDQRVTAHEVAMANYQRLGQLNQVRRMQAEIRLNERERETVQRLLEALDERFGRPGPYSTDWRPTIEQNGTGRRNDRARPTVRPTGLEPLTF